MELVIVLTALLLISALAPVFGTDTLRAETLAKP
jgi:hypothetical protein